MPTVNLYSAGIFGASKTGLLANVRYRVLDSAGNPQIAPTNSGVFEMLDAAGTGGTGTYPVVIAIDPTWLPCLVEWTIVGVANFGTVDILGNDPAVQSKFAVASVGAAVVPDGGTVSASPAPTNATFTATGNLNAPTGGYTAAPMWVYWTSGPNRGVKYAISSHTASGGNHAFTVAVMPVIPSSTDTFIIV